ncbi:hypothetical protein HXX76_004838 [Chlamydomonas incerta]|uniref:Uncharacterized protein n=1 Tax=Chlamydomonas incerta TaxID=51695 RepID=A0A835W6Y9_CHLIN|nr:hypothetical protein HXX76_004838 [Chlamydomonas incerta]|eukprot:KAG2439484.1 hypothetical protein HXX76_004838 [Chlamydomonas incerta]
MKKLEDVSQKLNREQPGAPGALSTSQTTKEQADARQPQSGGSAQDPASGVERAKSLASRLIEQVERQDTMCSKALSRLEEYADKLKQPLPTVRPVSVPATAAAAAAPLPDGAASVHGLGASGTVGVHAVPSTSGGPLPLGTMTVDVQAAVRARMAEHSDPVPATAALAQEIHAQAAARLAAAAALRRLPLGVSLPSQPGLGVGAVGGTAAAAPQQPGSPAAGAAPAAAMSNVVPAPSATAPQHHEQPPAAAAAETQAQGAAQAQASQPQQGAALDTAPGAVEAAYAPGVARA